MNIRVYWTIRLTEERANELIRYETAGLPRLRTTWEIHFAPAGDGGETEVHETMTFPFGTLGSAALGTIGRFPAEEVSANLRRLNEIMETGKVTDTSYSVPGKFPQ